MNRLRYSLISKADLLEIGQYSVASWGANRASRYLDELEACCESLARTPGMGRAWRHKETTFRRMEHGSHVIFYTEETYGVLVRRILHKAMIPADQPFDEG